MHILDIAMNSIKADASLVEINIEDSIKNNRLMITIADNGKGMSEDVINRVTNPFYTTRSTRKVGLGIPMLKEACERCNGYLKIESKIGVGTKVFCNFERDNIDRAPLGSMGETIMAIINSGDNFELIYTHKTDTGEFIFDTSEVKGMIEGIDIKDIGVLLWIKEYINENVNIVLAGKN
ncbi:MAG: HAMP domain-containing sensor histidine kinase [Tissierellia bacterium]|nr:HAMP domain-containing sensor histidine kinase [Tissierellia bacterium]MDD3227201.1 HAMP domain-containing sensor histidine kinase [Tissierellia bacterium]MDD3751410.1 HAMP domain-containing sensor histidine kinase [Tissierellia bacterium]MDD4046819.1 HAMP domain-containing sensor histidine kinase [Tissierellia bacterium]MDD4678789.1 HAMP domain-containing sensor histidine kinase [Tissierellia bacterium]